MEGLGATFATSPLGLESHLNGLLGQGYERSLIFESCSGDLEEPLYLNSPVLGVVRKQSLPICSYFGRAASLTAKYREFPMTIANLAELADKPTPPKNWPLVRPAIAEAAP